MQIVNGYRVAFIKIPGAKTITTRALFNVGSCCESEQEHGAAHFLEHCFFKGTTNKNFKQLEEELMSLGDSNAYTGYDRTGYLINSLPEDFEKSFKLLCELLFESRFDSAEFEKERKVIQEEIQMYLDEPLSFFYGQMFGHIYNTHNIAGTKESVGNMTVDDLVKFKNKHYTKSNMIFVVAGDLDNYFVVNTCNEVLASYNVDCGVANTWGNIQSNLSDLSLKHSAEQAIMAMVVPAASYKEAKEKNYVDDLFLNAFVQATHSVLFNRIRQELGLCYAIFGSGTGYGGIYNTVIYALIDPKNIDLVQDEIRKCIDDVKSGGISQRTLDISVKNILFKTARKVVGPEGRAEFMYSPYFIANEEHFCPDEYMNGIRKLTRANVCEYIDFIFNKPANIIVMNNR